MFLACAASVKFGVVTIVVVLSTTTHFGSNHEEHSGK
jgi:hypothetical protein